MSFFRQFPTTTYDFNLNGASTTITDIFRSVDVDESKIDSQTTYTYYQIQDGERPDVVSQKLYSTPDYYWTFFVANESLKSGISGSWPMSEKVLDTYLTEHYDGMGVLILAESIVVDQINLIQNGVRVIANLALTPKQIQSYGLPAGTTFDFSTSRVNHYNTLAGANIDSGAYWAQNQVNGSIFPIVSYNPDMAQLWLQTGGIGSVRFSGTLAGDQTPWTYPPLITFSSVGGAGAAAEGIISSTTGSLTGIRMMRPGSGYDTTDASISASIIERPVIPAAARVGTISGGLITTITVTEPGQGYCRPPIILVDGTPLTSAQCPITLNSTGGIVVGTLGSISATSAMPIITFQTRASYFDAVSRPIVNTLVGIPTTTTWKIIASVNPFRSIDPNYSTADVANSVAAANLAAWELTTCPAQSPGFIYTPTQVIGLGRYAPSRYISAVTSQTVSAVTYFSGAAGQNVTIETIEDRERAINESKTAIRVIRPEQIKSFVATYRALINGGGGDNS